MSLFPVTIGYFSVLLTSSALAAKPNVVLLMADDLGWGDLGCYNEKSPIHTPHLDAMAANGVRFDRFYAASAVCSPTRASCLTGRNPERMGIHHANTGHLPQEEITMAELLQKAGYRTGHFGKWHLGTLTKTVRESNRGGPAGAAHYSPPWEHGFEVCFSTEAKVPTWDPMCIPKKPEGGKRWWTPTSDPAERNSYGTRYWNEKGEEQKENLEGDDSRVIMDRAVEFIEGAVEEKQPFFSVIWFHSPHLPVVTGGPYAKRYADQAGHDRSYYGCVTALDDQVGRLRKLLRQLGVTGNTMVFFCADNGPEGKSGDPGQTNGLRGRKRSLYEGGVRVPGILEWPGGLGTQSRETEVPAFTSDYLPTVLSAAGIEYPAKRPLDGVNLLSLIKDEEKERSKGLGFTFAGQKSWMEGEWKAVLPSKAKVWELYKLTEDAGEQKDVAKDHPDQTKRMAASHSVWSQSCEKSLAGEDYGE